MGGFLSLFFVKSNLKKWVKENSGKHFINCYGCVKVVGEIACVSLNNFTILRLIRIVALACMRAALLRRAHANSDSARPAGPAGPRGRGARRAVRPRPRRVARAARGRGAPAHREEGQRSTPGVCLLSVFTTRAQNAGK